MLKASAKEKRDMGAKGLPLRKKHRRKGASAQEKRDMDIKRLPLRKKI
jgi:hypothetical protein